MHTMTHSLSFAFVRRIAIRAALLLMAACCRLGAAEDTAMPIVKKFEVTPEVAVPGSEFTVSWEVENAEKITLKFYRDLMFDLKGMKPVGEQEFSGSRTFTCRLNGSFLMTLTGKAVEGQRAPQIQKVAWVRVRMPEEAYETLPGLEPGVQEYDYGRELGVTGDKGEPYEAFYFAKTPTRVVPTLDVELPAGHAKKVYEAYLKVPKDGMYEFRGEVNEQGHGALLFLFTRTRAALMHGKVYTWSPEDFIQTRSPWRQEPVKDFRYLEAGWHPIRATFESDAEQGPEQRGFRVLWGEAGKELHVMRADELAHVPPAEVEKLKDLYPVTWRRIQPEVKFPDDTYAQTWEPEAPLSFETTLYVDGATGADSNNGSKNAPFKTIGKAAEVAQPGTRVVVRKGLYRESVVLPRGGSGVDTFISYEAEPGVVVRGSKVLEGWTEVPEGRNLWKVSIADLAPEDENPFLLRCTPDALRHRQQTVRYIQPYRGMLYLDGRRIDDMDGSGLKYVGDKFTEVVPRVRPGKFLVNRETKELYLALDGDTKPRDVTIEATFCLSVFGPRKPGIGFVRVKGFTFEHASSSIGFPQQGAVTTWCGHHWIIEDNTIRQAFGIGLDCGIREEWIALPPVVGYHIVRRNLFSHCGQGGIVSVGSGNRLNNHTNYDFHEIIEDNVVLKCGYGGFRGVYEQAGIKIHLMRHSLLRGNRIFDQGAEYALWTDWMFFDNRITENVVWQPEGNKITTLMVESQYPGRNIYANNILYSQGHGIRMSRNRYLHNLIRSPGNPIYSTGSGGGFGFRAIHFTANLLDCSERSWKLAEKTAKQRVALDFSRNVRDCMKIAANPADMTLTVELTEPLETHPVVEYCPLDFYGRPRSAAGTMPGPFDKLEVGKPVTIEFFPEWLREDTYRLAQAKEALGEGE